jgi:soluble lytic murein transglycosylase
MFSAFRISLLLSALVLGATAHGAEDPYKAAREAFQRAYERVDSGAADLPDADTEGLRSYPLYPYLQAARLRRALLGTSESPEAIDQRIETFLAYYNREPVTRELRRAWLTSLADRALWTSYLKHYRDTSTDDAQRCQSFVARIALVKPEDPPSEDLTADIAKQWLTPQSLPECEQPFAWLKAQNRLTPALIEQRARLALDKGNSAFARQMAALLPAPQAAPLLLRATLIENPRRIIDELIATPGMKLEPDVLLDGWTRLARKDRPAATARYEAFLRSRHLDEKAASPYALALALALAWDRDPAALKYFGQVDAADLDDAAREWQTRAALWAQDWPLVARSISAMSSTSRQTARWRYWAARAAEQTHDPLLARQLYSSVLVDDNYYSAMAAARLEEAVRPHSEKLVVDRTQLSEIQQLPALVRAHQLLLCNLRSQAGTEWQYGYETLSENARTQAIHLAAEWGWYDQAVTTASQRQVYNDYALLYPRPYDEEVQAGARLAQLEPELIYGVLRQESLYRADATSPVGARGLLQLLPETARRTAQTLGRPKPTPDELYEPAINVPLGAAQLRGLIDKFGGHTAVALAGYNAGPNAALRWLPAQVIDSDIWVENIPYNETRGYVQRVLWHSIVFAWLRSGEPQRTDSWLTRIAPATEPVVLGTL